jgi:hypothetical protein
MLLGSSLVIACGPGQSAGGGSEAADGESDGSTGSESDGATEDDGETDESETGETDEGETETGGEPSECHGGEWFNTDWGWLKPTTFDDEFWDWSTTHTLACVVASVVDREDLDGWEATLDCEGDGVTVELGWWVPDVYGLLDPTWAERSLSVVAQGGHPAAGNSFAGWMVVRDEASELVWISAGPWLPEAEWTDPVSLEVLDLGHDCSLVEDRCYPVYANVVLFDSPLDGELRSYLGHGHQTEHFTYLGESTTYEDHWQPFGSECRIFNDAFYGRWDEVRVVRRPCPCPP